MYVICRNDSPIAVVATEELAKQNKKLIQKYYDDEMRMEELRGSSLWNRSYIRIHEVPELKSTEDFTSTLPFINRDLPELLAYWEANAIKKADRR